MAAIKILKSEWTREGCLLAVHADNIMARTMIDSLRGGSTAVSILAWEVALKFGDSTHRPAHRRLFRRLQQVADEPSRSQQPGVTIRVPDP